MAALEWLGKVFQGPQKTRGLSGAQRAMVALDGTNSFYNFRLQRHFSALGPTRSAESLWYTHDDVETRTGLGVHLADALTDGHRFSDVLVILAEEDHDALMASGGLEHLGAVLSEKLSAFLAQSAFSAQVHHDVVLVRDGSEELGGQHFGLMDGEFITGLVPNYYRPQSGSSRAVIGVHANVPGAWEGYRPVARLYDDQVLFTLGNHWLDNFSHPSLGEAALYHLKLDEVGSFVHYLNPDVQGRYRIDTTVRDGTNIISVSTADGQPLVHLVLTAVTADAVEAGPRKKRETILPSLHDEQIFTMTERGALLQKVHFSKIMLGYDVHADIRGQLGTGVEDRALSFRVREDAVSVAAFVDGVEVNGTPLASGDAVPLDGDVVIRVQAQELRYRDLRGIQVEGWPYLGEIHRPASSAYLSFGDRHPIGRARDCAVVLPDEPRNDNIVWRPQVAEGSTIRSKSGEIPKANFYTDSIMVGSEHAELDLSGATPTLHALHARCFTFIRRQGEIIPVHPLGDEGHNHEQELRSGDELLIGNCLFRVEYALEEPELPELLPEAIQAEEGASARQSLHSLDPSALHPVESDDPSGRQSLYSLDTSALEPIEEESLGWDGVEERPTTEEVDVMAAYLGRRPEVVDDLDDEWPYRPKLGGGVARRAHQMPHLGGGAPIVSRTEEPQRRPRMSIADVPDPRAVPEEVQLPDDLPRRVYDSIIDFPDDYDDEAPTSFEVIDQLPDGAVAGSLGAHAPSIGLPEVPARAAEEIEAPVEVEAEAPVAFEAPVEAEASVAFEAQVEADAPVAFEALVEAEAPVAVETPVEAEAPVAVEPPVEAEAPAEVEQPIEVADAAPSEPKVSSVVAPAPAAPEAVAPPVASFKEATPSSSGPQVHHSSQVVEVLDSQAQFELGRSIRLVLKGWSIKGSAVVGNHAGADVILPENRIDDAQVFAARDYLRFQVRGRRMNAEVLDASEVRVAGASVDVGAIGTVADTSIGIIRRDDFGDEDFQVVMSLAPDARLPDPRAALLSVDMDHEPLAASLFTLGLPRNSDRHLNLGGIEVTARCDGARVTLRDYLASYRIGEGGFRPFFVSKSAGRFQTAPEDGSDIELSVGDQLMVGHAIYEVIGS